MRRICVKGLLDIVDRDYATKANDTVTKCAPRRPTRRAAVPKVSRLCLYPLTFDHLTCIKLIVVLCCMKLTYNSTIHPFGVD